MDIARQPPDPASAKTGPEQEADRGDYQADDNKNFAKVAHKRSQYKRRKSNTLAAVLGCEIKSRVCQVGFDTSHVAV